MPGRHGTAIVIPPSPIWLASWKALQILLRQTCRLGAKRNKPKAGPAGQILDPLHAIRKQTRIAAKLVHKKALDHCGVGRIEHRLGSGNLGDDAAAIDIAQQYHWHISGAGKAHIGDIILAQIDFRRAPGAFDKHQIRLFAQRRETAEDGWQKLGF